MQIFPDNYTEAVEQIKDLTGNYSDMFGNAGTDIIKKANVFAKQTAKKAAFDKMLSEAEAKVDVTKTVSKTMNGTLSRTDLLTLRDSLADEGVNPDRLNRLNSLVDSGSSVTLSKVKKVLSGQPVDDIDPSVFSDLTDLEKQQLNMLFRKMGLGIDEANNAISDLEKGGDVSVWNSLKKRMAGMSEGDTLDVSKDEMSAFARGFRLSDKQRGDLEGMFGGGDLTLSGLDLKNMLTSVDQEMSERARSDSLVANKDILEKSFRKTLLSSAEKDKSIINADNHDSPVSKRLETRIENSTTGHGKENIAPAPNKYGKDHSHSTEDDAPKQQNTGTDQKGSGGTGTGTGAGASKTSPQSGTAAADGQPFGNITVDASNLANNVAVVGKKEGQPQAYTNNARLFSQVENGILQNLENGTKQLTLQLTPDNLGSLTVILSVREKEVSAIIKPDNPETAKLIDDQLQKVRAALEEHGLKVEHLEVRSGLSEENLAQDWQGSSQHNHAREELANRDRIRLLSKLRHSDEPMAQVLHNTNGGNSHAANISASELYIVA